MSTYGYLAHHGVKGQKWGVRKQVTTSGRTHASVRPSPDKRKAIAIAAVAAVAATSVTAAGIGIAKNPEAVTKALGSIGKAFAKTATKGDIWKGTAKKSAKAFKKNKAIKKQWRKDDVARFKSGVKRAGSAIKKAGKQTASGVFEGLKEAGHELAQKDTIKEIVKDGVVKGAKGVAGTAIIGSMALGVKSAVSGQAPTRQEVTSYLITNPNKKKK